MANTWKLPPTPQATCAFRSAPAPPGRSCRDPSVRAVGTLTLVSYVVVVVVTWPVTLVAVVLAGGPSASAGPQRPIKPADDASSDSEMTFRMKTSSACG